MTRRRPSITETELSLLRMLWELGPSPVRELRDRLYPGGGHSEYATVQSLLSRLEKKGGVTRSREGRINVYRASVTRAELLKRRLRETADALCGGSLAPLVSQLIQVSNPTPEEADVLRSLVDRLQQDREEDR